MLKNNELGTCDVCARGALFLSKVRLYNDCQVAKGITYGAVNLTDNTGQGGAFGDLGRQLEVAFESWENEPWHTAYPDPEDRLIALMKNVIRNKGNFKSNELKDPRNTKNLAKRAHTMSA